MSKMDLVRQEMVAAMKAKDTARKDVLSLLLSSLKAKYIDKRADLTEEEENAVILREMKQTKETLDSTPPERTDLLEECKFRLGVLAEFAPQSMSEEEIRTVIQKVLAELGITAPQAKDKGRIMKSLMPLVKGKADGGLVNQMVGELFEA